MPTNLPAEAKKKWNQAIQARNPKEKLRLLQEFLGLIPKHKGTSKLCAQTKRQIATLRKEIAEKEQRRAGKGGPKFFLQKEGAAQIVILGETKVGRSSLLTAVTNAKAEISDYPYTTREPIPGMLSYKDIQFQIVEAPALVEGAAEGRAWGLQTLGLARNADGLILMVDLSQNPENQLSLILNELEKARIVVQKPKGEVQIQRLHMAVGLSIFVLGRLTDCSLNDVKEMLKSYGIVNAIVKIFGEVSLDDVEDAIFESTNYRPAIIVANKLDVAGATEKLETLKKFVDGKIKIFPVSCKNGFGLKNLGAEIFDALEIIRVYTKSPSDKAPSPKPFILKRGATVSDLAKQIHSDFLNRFLHAKVWAERLSFSPQKVGLSFVLEDGDIIELHAK